MKIGKICTCKLHTQYREKIVNFEEKKSLPVDKFFNTFKLKVTMGQHTFFLSN